MLTSEIQINEYDLLPADKVQSCRRGSIRNYLSYNGKSYFSKDIEFLFFELLLPNTKPILVGTIYRPPNKQILWRVLMKICLK